MTKIALIAIFVAILLPSVAHGETVLRTGEEINVTEDQVVGDDYYVWVGPLGKTSMSGIVKGDMYAFGGTVNVNGSIGEDLTVMGGSAYLNATVTDDVRVVAGDVTIGDHVGGDLFVLGGTLTLLSTASVGGDVFFFGGQGVIAGEVAGSVMGTSEKLRIDAKVGKDVDVKAVQGLTLGDQSVITGSLTYASPIPLSRGANATVEGEIAQKEYAQKAAAKSTEEIVLPFFMSLFAALSLFLLFRKQLIELVQHVYMHPLQSSLFGISFAILGPIVSVLLMVTVLGVFLGVSLFAFFALMCVLAYVLSGVVLGAWLSHVFTKKLQVSLLWIIVGVALIHGILFVIPPVGIVFMLGLFVMTVGAMVFGLYKQVT